MPVEVHLRTIRRESGQTLAQISAQTEGAISRSTLADLENRVTAPRLRQLELLARVYQCHPLDLITFTGFPPPRRCLCGAHTEEVP